LLSTKPPLIIAHRGASIAAPENTLAAFGQALDAGADGLELDVRLALDSLQSAATGEAGQRVPFLDDIPQYSEDLPAAGIFHMGDRVRHQVFGTGLVLKAHQEDGDQKLMISFLNFGQKKLMASKAGLEKLSKS